MMAGEEGFCNHEVGEMDFCGSCENERAEALQLQIQTLRQSLKERDSVILKAKELIEDYEYSLWEQDDIVERNVCPDCGNPEDEEHEADCKFDEVLKAIESLKSPHDGIKIHD